MSGDLFGQLGNLIGAVLDFVQVHNGLGRPQYYLSEHQVHEVGKISYGQWMQTFATLMWTKISICLFLLRIPVSKLLIRPLQASIVFLVVSNVILTVLWIVQCRPVAAVWDTSIDGSCFTKGQLERIIISQAGRQPGAISYSNRKWAADDAKSYRSSQTLHFRLIQS